MNKIKKKMWGLPRGKRKLKGFINFGDGKYTDMWELSFSAGKDFDQFIKDMKRLAPKHYANSVPVRLEYEVKE